MRLTILAALPALAFALPALAEDVAPAITGSYLCDGGQRIQVAYLNPPGGPSMAVVAWDGRLIPMQAGPTGSGVRYVAYDAASGLVWHTKGDAGFLARDTGSIQTTLLDGCTMQPQ